MVSKLQSQIQTLTTKGGTQPRQSTRITRGMRPLPPISYVEVEKDEEDEGTPVTEQQIRADAPNEGENFLTQVREMLRKEVAMEIAKRWPNPVPPPSTGTQWTSEMPSTGRNEPTGQGQISQKPKEELWTWEGRRPEAEQEGPYGRET